MPSPEHTSVLKPPIGPQRIAIITTGGHDLGMGHAIRQLALAERARAEGHEIIALTDAPAVAELFTGRGLSCEMLQDLDDVSALADALERNACSRVVIDVHQRDFARDAKLANTYRTTLMVSPVGYDFEPYGSDMILMGDKLSEWQHESAVPGPTGLTRVHSGRTYLIFRDEFGDDPGSHAAVLAPSILICHGGADPHGLTLRSIQALESTDGVYPVTVLVGSAFGNTAAIRGAAGDSKHDCTVIENPESVAPLMREAAVALINGGNIRYELCLTATPYVALSFQPSQYDCTEQLVRLGVGVNLGLAADITDQAIANSVELLLRDADERERMQDAMAGLFDTGGARRVLSIVLGLQETEKP